MSRTNRSLPTRTFSKRLQNHTSSPNHETRPFTPAKARTGFSCILLLTIPCEIALCKTPSSKPTPPLFEWPPVCSPSVSSLIRDGCAPHCSPSLRDKRRASALFRRGEWVNAPSGGVSPSESTSGLGSDVSHSTHACCSQRRTHPVVDGTSLGLGRSGSSIQPSAFTQCEMCDRVALGTRTEAFQERVFLVATAQNCSSPVDPSQLCRFWSLFTDRRHSAFHEIDGDQNDVTCPLLKKVTSFTQQQLLHGER